MFNATDGDYCIEAILPKFATDDDQLQFLLHIWIIDDDNYASFRLCNDGEVALGTLKGNSYHEAFTVKNFPSYKPEENAVNALRVVAKDGKITVVLNGTLVKVIRAQEPMGTKSFGIIGQYANTDKADTAAPRTILVKSYKVTAGS